MSKSHSVVRLFLLLIIHSTMDSKQIIEIFDPHFHLWNLNTENSTDDFSISGHDHALLGNHHYPGKIYDIHAYLSDWDDLVRMPNFRLSGGCIMDVASVCFPKNPAGSELANRAQTMEYQYFKDQASLVNKAYKAKSYFSSKIKFYVSPGVLLQSGKFIEDHLQILSDDPEVKSVRQILNQNPDWPRQSVNPENLLKNESWISGFKKLNDLKSLSFEIHLNPHQFLDMANVISNYGQNVPSFIICHLGTFTWNDLSFDDILNESDAFNAKMNSYFNDLQVLKDSHPNVYVKVSYLFYMHKSWHQEPVYSKLGKVLEKVFQIFGKDKVIFASNYPLDKWSKDLDKRRGSDWLITNYIKILKEFVFKNSENTVQDLDNFFSKNAMKAYNIQ